MGSRGKISSPLKGYVKLFNLCVLCASVVNDYFQIGRPLPGKP